MKKRNKGINLLALIITVIVMIILATITIFVSANAYQRGVEAKKDAERLQVVRAIENRFGENQRNELANPLAGFVIPEEKREDEEEFLSYLETKIKSDYQKKLFEIPEQLEEMKNFFQSNKENQEYTRILLYTDMIELGIENVTEGTVYVVNYYSDNVVGPLD